MSTNNRIVSVDLLRGLVMIIMALDHVRHYFSPTPLSPEDMSEPGLALFLTRWITHYCAPVFVFLSGVSAWLHAKSSGASLAELRRFLVSRGSWLVVAEFLLINPFIPLWIDSYLLAQVIWAIGWSMVVLGLLLPLGRRALGIIALAIVFGHNLLDGISSDAFGTFAPLWIFLHEENVIALGGGWNLYAAYPVLAWIGVTLLGYAAGKYLTDGDWQRKALGAGACAVLGFVLLRGFNVYGNPAEFVFGDTLSQSLINFINVEKYPPSLQYLLMTLGPALMLMPVLENWRGNVAGCVSTFGRVPFFYYVLHFALILALATLWSWWEFGTALWWFRGEESYPAAYTFTLVRTYVVWIALVLALYLPCRWYAGFKRRRRDLWWLSYA